MDNVLLMLNHYSIERSAPRRWRALMLRCSTSRSISSESQLCGVLRGAISVPGWLRSALTRLSKVYLLREGKFDELAAEPAHWRRRGSNHVR